LCQQMPGQENGTGTWLGRDPLRLHWFLRFRSVRLIGIPRKPLLEVADPFTESLSHLAETPTTEQEQDDEDDDKDLPGTNRHGEPLLRWVCAEPDRGGFSDLARASGPITVAGLEQTPNGVRV